MAGTRTESTTWSSHSPPGEEAPVTRATWPSAESIAYPRANSRAAITAVSTVGSASSSTAMAPADSRAETAVTPLGPIPSATAPAAKTRAARRLTHRV